MAGKTTSLLIIAAIISVGLFVLRTNLKNTSTSDPDASSQRRTITTTIDDDPVKGASTAPVTIVEFSDFECPYCKLFFKDTLPQLESQYIDMGKVKLVYRDLPLVTHEPAATSEARAANCAREQGGDEVYFRYHNNIFLTTKSGGSGLTLDQIMDIAKKMNLDEAQFNSCYTSAKYADEVKADFEEAVRIGAKSTPTFVIGKTRPDGVVDGVIVEGAAPFALIQSIVDPLLYE